MEAAGRKHTAQDFHGQPLHNAARQNIDTATRQINQAKERLGSVKDWIVQSAKDAVAAVREKGIGALDSALSFLGVRKGLESMRENLDSNIQSCDRSLARVDTISRQYHEVGTATRNFGRAVTGKEIHDDTKESGRMAKLAAAPFATLKSLYTNMAKGTDAALGKLERLEQAARGAETPEKEEQDEQPDTEKPTPGNTYAVYIAETFSRTVEIEAGSPQEAEAFV